MIKYNKTIRNIFILTLIFTLGILIGRIEVNAEEINNPNITKVVKLYFDDNDIRTIDKEVEMEFWRKQK